MLNQVRNLILAAAMLSPIVATAVHAEDAHKGDLKAECDKDKADNREKRADRDDRREHRREHHRMHVAVK